MPCRERGLCYVCERAHGVSGGLLLRALVVCVCVCVCVHTETPPQASAHAKRTALSVYELSRAWSFLKAQLGAADTWDGHGKHMAQVIAKLGGKPIDYGQLV